MLCTPRVGKLGMAAIHRRRLKSTHGHNTPKIDIPLLKEPILNHGQGGAIKYFQVYDIANEQEQKSTSFFGEKPDTWYQG